MDNALVGFLAVFGFLHILLIAVPLVSVFRSSISTNSKLFWCVFVIFLPLIGVAIMHFRYRTSLFQGKPYEISAAEERARSGTLSPHDHD